MTVNCPKCGVDISDTFEENDPSVGINAGWYCDACDLGVAEHEVERERFDDDVPIPPAPRRPDGKIGTPISELRGRPEFPGDPRYEEFCRIARTYGYD